MAIANLDMGLLLLVISSLFILTGCIDSQQHFNKHHALFVFGDSLFDSGNNNYINTTTIFQANFWPYGISYFNPPSGRFSDGRLIPDFIAEYAGLPLIPTYLDPRNKDFVQGANFASGGAGALVESRAGFVVDLKTQLRYFGDLQKQFRQSLGDAKTDQLLSDAVYLFSCGANDYLTLVGNNDNVLYPYTHEQYVGMVIGNLTDVFKYAGLPLIPTYLNPRNKDFVQGANFASGGAGALVESRAGFVVDLKTQLRYFGDLQKQFRQSLGDAKTDQLLSDAVYLFSCGANDYLTLVGNNDNVLYPYTHEQYVGMVIGNLTDVFKETYKLGGRKFGILNVLPLACIPNIRAGRPGSTCNQELDIIVSLHNKQLSKKLQELEKQLEGFMYAKFDLNTEASNRMKNPSRYGLKIGDMACCGSGPLRGIYSCGGTRGVEEFELCDNVDEYLFFDPFHFSEVAYAQYAEVFWNGDSTPYNLRELFHMNIFSSTPLRLLKPNMSICS